MRAGQTGRAARVVWLVVFDGVQLLDVAGPVDVFDAANRLVGHEAYRLRLVAAGRTVRTGSGIRIEADEDLDASVDDVDTLVVAGGWGMDEVTADPRLVGGVARAAAAARRVTSVCTGAFVLAEAGLLAGRRATTHWSRTDRLGEGTGVRVEPDRIFVRDGQVWTSAGVTAGIDLALSLVEDDLGPHVARQVARWLVVFLHRPGGQSQFSQHLRRPVVSSDPIRAALDRVAADPSADHRVASLAEAVGLSRRQFARAFRAATGLTPGAHVELVRLEAAQRALESGRDTLAVIASSVGFGTEETMRQAFQRRLGISPGQYRSRFRDP
ncbi:GlxA family transcriptional regulator [Nitriliruptor alkaliphilus]|uniref:GlxA family transcriptional regulator n=1 Tax=Nitriliruptor alkaliphilus TaxID=427918 RepID=UPI000696D15D|nr:GlxA family transcriptional regulator [Nitriliruptor alkaliphilus]